MSKDKPSEIAAGLPHRLRAWRASFAADYAQWRIDVRSDWTLIYRNPIGAVAFTVLGVIVCVVAIRALMSLLPSAPGAGGSEAEAQYAVLHISCVNKACGATYDSKRPLTFREWPAICEKCQQRTAYRATLCPVCRKWYAVPPQSIAGCPHCAERNRPKKIEVAKPKKPVDPDDLDER